MNYLCPFRVTTAMPPRETPCWSTLTAGTRCTWRLDKDKNSHCLEGMTRYTPHSLGTKWVTPATRPLPPPTRTRSPSWTGADDKPRQGICYTWLYMYQNDLVKTNKDITVLNRSSLIKYAIVTCICLWLLERCEEYYFTRESTQSVSAMTTVNYCISMGFLLNYKLYWVKYGFFFSKTRQVDFLSPFYYKRDSKYTLYMGGYIDCNKKKLWCPSRILSITSMCIFKKQQ